MRLKTGKRNVTIEYFAFAHCIIVLMGKIIGYHIVVSKGKNDLYFVPCITHPWSWTLELDMVILGGHWGRCEPFASSW